MVSSKDDFEVLRLLVEGLGRTPQPCRGGYSTNGLQIHCQKVTSLDADGRQSSFPVKYPRLHRNLSMQEASR